MNSVKFASRVTPIINSKTELDITRRHKMGFLNITMDQIDPRDCISLKSNGYTSHGVATGYNVNKIL